jgi:hypothetical protein
MDKLYFKFVLSLSISLLFIFCRSSLINAQQIIIGIPTANLREQPDINSKSITQIPYKETVVIKELDNKDLIINELPGKWAKVQWKNKIGWVFNAYIKDQYRGIKSIFNLYNVSPINEN